ncbi:MAG: ANTAR domain-containing protein [Bacillota bacterium]
MYGYRVLLAIAETSDRNQLREILTRLGHNVIAAAAEARAALRLGFEVNPDVMVYDPALPDHGGAGALNILEEHRIAAVIIYSREEKTIIEQAKKGWVLAYLMPPLDDVIVAVTVEVAAANFQRLSALEQENSRLQKNLKERRLVEQARGLLAEKKGMTEQEAYHYLRNLSMNKRLPMVKVAKEIISLLGKN